MEDWRFVCVQGSCANYSQPNCWPVTTPHPIRFWLTWEGTDGGAPLPTTRGTEHIHQHPLSRSHSAMKFMLTCAISMTQIMNEGPVVDKLGPMR